MKDPYFNVLKDFVSKGFVFVVVKPNKRENKIVGFENDAFIVELKAKPVEGEANKVLVSFFKTLFKDYNVVLKSGFSSKKKKLLFEKKQ